MGALALVATLVPQLALGQTYPLGVPEVVAPAPDATVMPPDPADDPAGAPAIEPITSAPPLAAPQEQPAAEPAPQPQTKVAPQPLPPLPPTEELEAGVTCVITAYYSAVRGQQRYATGSYESELILEGNGTNGADGTQVFVGMIAASKQYPFGTKVYIPGFGMGEVHDRGGAIRGQCRLDIWMGKGDLGLSRALAWGKRTVVCRIFMPGRPVPPGLDDAAAKLQIPAATRQVTGDPVVKPFYDHDLTEGNTDAQVKDLERDLKKLQYFHGTPDEAYDLATAQAVFAFQKSQDIVRSEDSYGAGYFGYQTRRALSRWRAGDAKLTPATKSEQAQPQPQLQNLRRVISKGERSDEVFQAQELLGKLGYFPGQSTGIYGDQTRAAILKFQQEHGIVASAADKGAGSLGPVTAKALLTAVTALADAARVYAQGERGAVIQRTQEHLIALQRLPGDATTGFFGEQTLAAVRQFQLDLHLVSGKTDPNYGRLGPRTVAAIERERRQREVAVVALKRGDRGEAVKEVQRLLVAIGGFDGPVTGYFGAVTEEAVRAFQMRTRLIARSDDVGAGMVGPITKQKLLAIREEKVAVAAADTPGATVTPSQPQ